MCRDCCLLPWWTPFRLCLIVPIYVFNELTSIPPFRALPGNRSSGVKRDPDLDPLIHALRALVRKPHAPRSIACTSVTAALVLIAISRTSHASQASCSPSSDLGRPYRLLQSSTETPANLVAPFGQVSTDRSRPQRLVQQSLSRGFSLSSSSAARRIVNLNSDRPNLSRSRWWRLVGNCEDALPRGGSFPYREAVEENLRLRVPTPCRIHRRKCRRRVLLARRRKLRCIGLGRSHSDVGSPDARAHQFNHGAAGAKTAVVNNIDFAAATTTRLDPWSRGSRAIFAGCFISFMCAASRISRALLSRGRLTIERRSRTVMMDR